MELNSTALENLAVKEAVKYTATEFAGMAVPVVGILFAAYSLWASMTDAPDSDPYEFWFMVNTWNDSATVTVINGPESPKVTELWNAVYDSSQKIGQTYVDLSRALGFPVINNGFGVVVIPTLKLLEINLGFIKLKGEPGDFGRFIVQVPVHLMKASRSVYPRVQRMIEELSPESVTRDSFGPIINALTAARNEDLREWVMAEIKSPGAFARSIPQYNAALRSEFEAKTDAQLTAEAKAVLTDPFRQVNATEFEPLYANHILAYDPGYQWAAAFLPLENVPAPIMRKNIDEQWVNVRDYVPSWSDSSYWVPRGYDNVLQMLASPPLPPHNETYGTPYSQWGGNAD